MFPAVCSTHSPCFCNSLARTKIILSSLLKCSVLFTGSAAAIYSLLLPYYLTYLGFLPLAWFLHPVNMATWLTNHHKHLPQADSVLCFLSPTVRLTSISLAVPVPTHHSLPLPLLIHWAGVRKISCPLLSMQLSLLLFVGEKAWNTSCALTSLYFCCFLLLLFPFLGFHFLLSHWKLYSLTMSSYPNVFCSMLPESNPKAATFS